MVVMLKPFPPQPKKCHACLSRSRHCSVRSETFTLKIQFYCKTPTFVINKCDTLFVVVLDFSLLTLFIHGESGSGLQYLHHRPFRLSLTSQRRLESLPPIRGSERGQTNHGIQAGTLGRGTERGARSEGHWSGDTREREYIWSVQHCAEFIGIQW